MVPCLLLVVFPTAGGSVDREVSVCLLLVVFPTTSSVIIFAVNLLV